MGQRHREEAELGKVSGVKFPGLTRYLPEKVNSKQMVTPWHQTISVEMCLMTQCTCTRHTSRAFMFSKKTQQSGRLELHR